jgi:hypothetical protein
LALPFACGSFLDGCIDASRNVVIVGHGTV